MFRRKKNKFRVELQWSYGENAETYVIWACVFAPWLDPHLGDKWFEIARGPVTPGTVYWAAEA